MFKFKIAFAALFFIFSMNSFAQSCGSRTEILVICHKKKLLLCKQGQVLQQFNVALGRGGIYKKMSGDNKTPIGDYPLELPRTSQSFGIFIPIGYPTASQASLGFTGSAVGIHGPYHYFSWFSNLNSLPNWTAGCIAVSKSSEIRQIASWVKINRPTNIRILA